MKHNPHKPAEFIFRILFGCALFAAGCVFFLSGLIGLISRYGVTMLVLSFFSLLLGISAFASFFYTLRNLLSTVVIDEVGMTFCRWGKEKMLLPWEAIRFAGCCTEDSYRGVQKRYCFADRDLTEEERRDIALIHTPNIYFSWLTQKELDFIQSHCPVHPDDSIKQFLYRSK